MGEMISLSILHIGRPDWYDQFRALINVKTVLACLKYRCISCPFAIIVSVKYLSK